MATDRIDKFRPGDRVDVADNLLNARILPVTSGQGPPELAAVNLSSGQRPVDDGVEIDAGRERAIGAGPAGAKAREGQKASAMAPAACRTKNMP